MGWYIGQQQQPSIAESSDTAATANAKTAARDGEGGTKSLLHHLFPEGNLARRRHEPRTSEARLHGPERPKGKEDDDVSLDDLTCSNCHLSHASDENDMLLCDGMGCYRSFHMKCLEPEPGPEDVREGEDWFCPLCTAHAELIHYAQREYVGDDWAGDDDEEEEDAEPKSGPASPGNRSSGSQGGGDMKEWETAEDVFPEAEFELRVAEKFKENVRDEETLRYLAETLGIRTGAPSGEGPNDGENPDLLDDDDDEEDDDSFDHEGEELDDDSLAEDVDMEKKLGSEKIGRDELDALSVTSDASDDDDEDMSASSNGDGEDAKIAPRRSRRRRFTLENDRRGDATSDDDEERSRSPTADIGTLDVANIVRGKRSRTKVDYRKLADAMFGDEEDEEAGARREYTFKPKKKKSRRGSSDDDESESDGEEEEEAKHGRKKEEKKRAGANAAADKKKKGRKRGRS